jgi:hypothetical protein
MNPRDYRRFEGFAVLVAALATYSLLEGPIWLLAVLALAPDLSMLGYLAGKRLGALSYNLAHVYAGPLALAGGAVWLGSDLALLGAVVWVGHIGADRLFGYGLKDETGFADTHLSGDRDPTERDPRGTPISGDESAVR